MKDLYQILGVDKTSSAEEIKKAFRKKSKQYHPDVNLDPNAEDKFKEVASAYETLGDTKKREEYDNSRNRGGSSFEDWVNDFGKSDSGFGRGSSRGGFNNARRNKIPTTDYLNVTHEVELDLIDAILGKPVEVKYERWTVGGDFLRSKTEKILNIHLDLRKKFLKATRTKDGYIINIKLDKLGSEDVHRRTNLWGDPEMILLGGDFHLTVKLNVPENMEIDDSNIIQYVDVPLYKTLFKGEKIRITTLLDKKYDAEISEPAKINDLKLNISGQGIMGSKGSIGNYVIRFNILPPDLSKVSKANLEIIKDAFIQE